MEPVKMTRAEYEAKYGTKPPVSATPAPVKMTRADYEAKYGKTKIPAVESDKGFLGNTAAGMVKPFARLATNVIQAGQLIGGRKESELTSPLSGKFLGDVKAVGVEDGGGLSWKNLKDSVGVGAEIASNIPIAKGAGITFDVLKGATKQGGRQLLKKAAMPLIKEGASAGVLAGGGSALQKDKTLGGTLFDAGVGGVIGGVAAPLFGVGGTILGKGLGKYTNIGNLFKGEESKLAKEAAEKSTDDIAQYVRAPLTTAEKAKLKIEKRGTEYGGLFGLGNKKFKLGEEDYRMAQAVKDLVDPRSSQADANVDRILKNVQQVHDNDLMPFLRENPVPYDWIDMKRYLDNKMKPSELLKINKDNSLAFNTIKKKGLDIIDQFPKTQEGVQQARTAIDNMINTEFGPAIWDKAHPLNSSVKEAALKLRTALNDFTHDSIRIRDIPTLNKVESFMKEARARGIKMDSLEEAKEALLKFFGTEILPENELKAIIFRQNLKNMNLKLKAADNIWSNSAKEVGKTRLGNLRATDPLLAGAVAGGTVYGLSKIFNSTGVGSASGNNTN